MAKYVMHVFVVSDVYEKHTDMLRFSSLWLRDAYKRAAANKYGDEFRYEVYKRSSF